MLDLRYHIYSLAAVFLSLAIGIVIGTSFAKSSPSLETSRRIIQRYEKDSNTLKAEIVKASQSMAQKDAVVKNCQDFCRSVMPIVLKDKLAWRSVAIIQTGDYGDLTGSIKQALEMAGAHVSSITEMSRDFPFDDNSKIAQVLVDSGVMPENTGNKDRDKLFSIIARAIQSGQHQDILSKLEAAGVCTFSGDYTKFNKLVVLVGGANSAETNTARSVDAQLVTQLEKLGVRTIGCETLDAVSSYVPEWHRVGIATVDNADSSMGQIAMVYALNGETAMFGVKEGAERLVPQTLETR